MSTAHRVHATRTIAKRDVRSILFGTGLYIALSVIFLLLAVTTIRDSVFQVSENGLQVFPSPINMPFSLAMALGATYLGLVSALSITRERDQGTLEVLFYGPVDSTSFVLAKYLQQMVAFLIVMVFSLAYFTVVSQYTNFGFSGNLLAIVLMSVFMSSIFVSFGILLSSLSRKVNTSIVLYLALMLFFVAFTIAHTVVMGLPDPRLSTVLIYARIILDNMNKVVQWISPIGYFDRGLQAAELGNMAQYAVSVLSSIVYTALLLGCSIVAFNRKGVRR